MFKRIRELNIASRRDVLLMTVATLVVFAIVTVWGVLLVGRAPFESQNVSKYVLTVLFFGAAAVVAVVPFVLRWDRDAGHPIARLIVRACIALQLFAVVSSVIGLLYATNPIVSVPVGFATFTAMLIGLLGAGFAGNTLAPATA